MGGIGYNEILAKIDQYLFETTDKLREICYIKGENNQYELGKLHALEAMQEKFDEICEDEYEDYEEDGEDR